MAGPVAAYVQLPDDSSNAGKKVNTETVVIGGNTVHMHRFERSAKGLVLGTYSVQLNQGTVSATVQDGVATGVLWAHIPSNVSGVKARIRRIALTSQSSAAFVGSSAPRLLASRFTYTGAATGAGVQYQRINMLGRYPQLDLRTAVTGLTVTLAGSVGHAPVCGALTAIAGYAPQQISEMDFLGDTAEEDEIPLIAVSEGLVIWQDVAGTTSDSRKYNLTVVWDEIDVS